jgi:geranylgeranyl pyrophosphate synthase
MKLTSENPISASKKCHRILEENGGVIAEKSRTIMLNDPTLNELKEPLEFISKNWRDPLTPSLLALSCETVNGIAKDTNDVALAMSLMNLSFFIWDDIIDHSSGKLFKPTLSGKFGSETALIIGGLVSAKAFSVLNNLTFNQRIKTKINQLIWNLWSVMAKAEVKSLKIRSKNVYSSKSKLCKIKQESMDPQICLKIGAIIGKGSDKEINSLGNYGSNLGVILGLINDFRVATNLTLELADKIKLKTLPYSLLIAMEKSDPLKAKINNLSIKEKINQATIKLIVKDILRNLVFEDIQKKVDVYVQGAIESLENLDQSTATLTLQSFIELQPKFFIESIPFLKS